MKIVCMIPARSGSKRIKQKNLRYLGDRPLIYHIINTAKMVQQFDEIYLNANEDIFKLIATAEKISFHQRDLWHGPDVETNDDFLYDFLKKIKCDIVIQLLPTSPFLSADDISDFIEFMVDGDYDTVQSVHNVQIECLFKGNPINFDKRKKMEPSQMLEPIQAYANGVTGWKRNVFLSNMKEYGYGVHGVDSKIGYYALNGISVFDIDTEFDFRIAEHIEKERTKYYTPVDEVI